MDQGHAGPVEVVLMHEESGAFARPSWESPLVFQESWQATMFIMAGMPLPVGCTWVKVHPPFPHPRITFSQLLKLANARVPNLDPLDPPDEPEKILRGLLLEL